MDIKGFRVTYNGDPSVGIFPASWEISGGFSFEDQAELDAFKVKLLEAWEYCSDTPCFVETFEEIEEQIKQEVDLFDIELTQEEVDKLNIYQLTGRFHPYTCGSGNRTDANHFDGEGILVATKTGWAWTIS